MYILNIDSTTQRSTMTLSSDGKIISSVSRESGRKYMEMIIEDIDHTLSKAGINIKDIDALGVNKGPGDFTGTRIGISVVKTFGWVLDKPVYGINALDVLAHSIASANIGNISRSIDSGMRTILSPCLDVRKSELYFSLYEISPGGNEEDIDVVAVIDLKDDPYILHRREKRQLVDADQFTSILYEMLRRMGEGKEIYAVIGGNCIEEYGKMISGFTSGTNNLLLDKKNIFPDPRSLDICVRQSIKNEVPPQRVDPVYVREFIPFGR
jgi:tRNA threonylcarbamoyl adenosine modification protein YeaZ